MQNFPIMSMRKGDAVTVTTDSGKEFRGAVENTSNTPGEGFAVMIKLSTGGYEWFYVREGAHFWH